MQQPSKISNGVKNIIFSPHPDDAVLSCGGLIKILAGDIMVVTVFSGNYKGLTDWDKVCGFNVGQNPIETRRQEDERALAKLGCNNYNHCDYLQESSFDLMADSDSFERFSPGADLFGFLEKFIKKQKAVENIYLPMGIKHPDHIRLRKAFVDLVKKKNPSEYNIYFYEDFPYLVDKKEYNKSFQEVKKDFSLKPQLINISPVLKDKVLGISQYKSQIRPIFGSKDIAQIKKSLLSSNGRVKGRINYYLDFLGLNKKVFERYWLIVNRE